MIKAVNILHRVGSAEILSGLDFEARNGELVAIIGPNGAGKTTLLRVLSGTTRPTSGQVLLRNIPLTQYSSRALARRRAVLAQHCEVAMGFLSEDVVMMGRYPHFDGRPSLRDHDIVEQAMRLTGVEEFGKRLIHSLSGGEAQRVHLARVLAQLWSNDGGHGVLFLDEPVNSLDIQYQHAALGIAQQWARNGFAVVVVLHDLNLAAQYADRVVLLEGGCKRAEGSPEQVLTAENLTTVYGYPLEPVFRNDQLLVVPAVTDPNTQVRIVR